MLTRPQREVVGYSSLLLSASLVAFLVFSAMRDTGSSVTPTTTTTTTTAPTIVIDNANQTVSLVAPTLACAAACGTGAGVRCNQSMATGIVFGCLACNSSSRDPMQRCTPIQTCSLYPFCSSAEATPRLVQLHNALLLAIAQNKTGDITQSANWTTLLQPAGVTQAQATSLVTTFLVGRQLLLDAGRGAETPLEWLDDQAGWWASSFIAYDAAVPAALEPYLAQLKRAFCTRTWLNSGDTCMAPTIIQ
jgi:hypothetical protein